MLPVVDPTQIPDRDLPPVPGGGEPGEPTRDAAAVPDDDDAGTAGRDRQRSPIRRVFIGWDHRQSVTYSVLDFSIRHNASVPVAIHPLDIACLPLKRTGLTPFTFTRFLVPWLCDYQGWALFLDADMLMLGDVDDLFKLADPRYAVMTVPKDGEQKFERAAMMLFNCAHPDCAQLTPAFIEEAPKLHGLGWTENIGWLPADWHHTVLYDETPEEQPKLIHFTAGIPVHQEVYGCPFTAHYQAYLRAMIETRPWSQVMGPSVHVRKVMEWQRQYRHAKTNSESGPAEPSPTVN